MSRLSASLILFALTICRPALSQFAPAGVPVLITNQETQGQRHPVRECLMATSNADGAAVQITECSSADPSSISWIVTKGSAVGSGSAPTTALQIFGNKCLDVTNGADAAGTKLQIWTCTGGPNQQFNVHNVDGFSTISWAADAAQCATLSGSGVGNIPVVINSCNNSNDPGRLWQIYPVAKPTQILWSGSGNLCLAASSNANGAAVIIDNCSGTPHTSTENRTFVLPAPGVTGQISTYNGAKCLDVTNGATADGTKLQVWDCTGGPNQQFVTEAFGIQTIFWIDGSPAVQNVIDVTNGNGTPGNQVQLWSLGNGVDSTPNPNQIFFI